MLLKNYIVLNLPNGNFIPKQQVDCKVGCLENSFITGGPAKMLTGMVRNICQDL